jgi:hypothetical protein
MLLKPAEPGEAVNLMPSDEAVLEEDEPRKDIPCTVTEHKPELGFDLRFHSGYEVTVPLRELSGEGDTLTVLFRVYPEEDKNRASYFVQHFHVPVIEDDAKGDAMLEGTVDIGEGRYHVDWLMRDRSERVCSSSWQLEATLGPKEKEIPLFINPQHVAQTSTNAFSNDAAPHHPDRNGNLNVKLLVNFAPQLQGAASLKRTDVDPLVSILKTIQRNSHVSHISLVAFNIDQTRVVYRQKAAEQIDFPSLGKALATMNLGTVNVQSLGEKHRETDFLESLIQQEMGTDPHPDAVIFAGPKAMLDADVPQDDLRRIGDVECPVFYLNYNLNPQAVPWKDSISHAIRVFKGSEFTISRPRDLWFSTTEVVNRILHAKRDRAVAGGTIGAGTGTTVKAFQ